MKQINRQHDAAMFTIDVDTRLQRIGILRGAKANRVLSRWYTNIRYSPNSPKPPELLTHLLTGPLDRRPNPNLNPNPRITSG